ncbi:MAG: hypothetical protein L3J74_00240 [Bacteroidales bacterium]|nr:hypothetical protein [Bacteroidales bacterium]
MNKIVLILAVLILSIRVNAQELHATGYELGIRLGSWAGPGASVDGVLKLGQNRIHADLGLFENTFTIESFYDWSFPIVEYFSFYPGVGGGMAFTDAGFVLGLGGELGFEYAFKIPLTIGLDWRPMILLVNVNNFGYNYGGLNIRYRF